MSIKKILIKLDKLIWTILFYSINVALLILGQILLNFYYFDKCLIVVWSLEKHPPFKFFFIKKVFVGDILTRFPEHFSAIFSDMGDIHNLLKDPEDLLYDIGN